MPFSRFLKKFLLIYKVLPAKRLGEGIFVGSKFFLLKLAPASKNDWRENHPSGRETNRRRLPKEEASLRKI